MIENLKNQRFEFIDGLRGIAALSVVLFHLKVNIQIYQPQSFNVYIDELLHLGHLGIQIFFVLSGFVIAYSLRQTRMDIFFFTRFLIRRSVRLDPSYWTIVGITLLLAIIANMTFKANHEFPFSFQQILYNILYLPDMMQVTLIVPVAWTLCLEFQFYFVFALLLLFMQRLKLRSYYQLIIWSGLSIFSILQNTPLAIIPEKPMWFIIYWYSFFLGCLTCWKVLNHITKSTYWFHIFFIALCSLWTNNSHAIVSLLVALLIYLVFNINAMHSGLKQGVFQYLGKISYSLYLIHWPLGMKLVDIVYIKIGSQLNHPLITTSFLILSLGFIILAADIFYRWIEHPSYNYSKRIMSNIGTQSFSTGS